MQTVVGAQRMRRLRDWVVFWLVVVPILVAVTAWIYWQDWRHERRRRRARST